jgi:putative thioredoxin
MTDEMNISSIAPGGGNGALIKDSSTAEFMADVIEASNEVPVIVDMWAPWCGPCKTLSPIIEKAVTDARGAVKLVKINVDENQELAAQLRVQSIPAVYAFKGGQPVDGFVGALPESKIREFIQKITGGTGLSPAEELIEAAKAERMAGDLSAAIGIFGQALKGEPSNLDALTGLAECYVEGEDLELARQTLALVPPEHANDPLMLAVRAQITLAEQVGGGAEGGGADLAALEVAVQANPNDQQARLDLADAYVAAGRREEAVEALLEMVGLDRAWNDEAARKQLVTLFDAFGPMDELTRYGRRQLSSLLFS